MRGNGSDHSSSWRVTSRSTSLRRRQLQPASKAIEAFDADVALAATAQLLQVAYALAKRLHKTVNGVVVFICLDGIAEDIPVREGLGPAGQFGRWPLFAIDVHLLINQSCAGLVWDVPNMQMLGGGGDTPLRREVIEEALVYELQYARSARRPASKLL